MAETSPLNMLANAEITGKKPENLVGLEKEDVDKYRAAQQEFIKSLEDRYRQPNLFSIAAGFAKPQLGGFTASLGSAMQSLGEQQEKQRDIQLPLYKAKSELAAYEMGLKQKGKAAANIEQAAKENRTLTPAQGMETTALEQGPSAGTKAGQEMMSSQADQLMRALAQGRDYTTIVKDLGKDFVDKNMGQLLKDHPNILPPTDLPDYLKPKPAGTGGAGGAGNVSNAPAPAPAPQASGIPGVPSTLTAGLTKGQELASTNEQIQKRIERVNELNKNLGSQATLAAPIYESATSLYQLASKPSLKPAFAIFEHGDPMSILGKAMEDQSLSSVLANARQQIIHARYGSQAEKDQALSDFHAFENALGGLNTAVITGFQNPTDARSMIEKSAVPNAKNTRDAFLRGIARLGSDALTRYETKNAFDTYLKSPNADVNNWESSDHYKKVLENSQKRNTDLISNQASAELPAFMRNGLKGSYTYTPDKKDLKAEVKRLAEEKKKHNP